MKQEKEISRYSNFSMKSRRPGYGKEWIYFPDGDDRPHLVNLSSPVVMVQGVKEKKVQYRLFARNLNDYILIDQAARPIDEVKISKMLSNKPIKLVTHGWMSSAEKSVVVDIKNAYLAVEDVIVIGVDWSNTAMDLMYPIVAEATGAIGTRLGQFLDAFCKRYDVSGDRIHLIGHSLGAHVMGVAASTSNVRVGRLTGLDPARPLFEYPKMPDAFALSRSDAKFVDVIHSCGGMLGVQHPTGHADFYPNSGEAPQPGCNGIPYLWDTCSHSRSYVYFVESIYNPTAFPACRNVNWKEFLASNECSNQTFMGKNVDGNASGQYYLKTNSKQPYGRS